MKHHGKDMTGRPVFGLIFILAYICIFAGTAMVISAPPAARAKPTTGFPRPELASNDTISNREKTGFHLVIATGEEALPTKRVLY